VIGYAELNLVYITYWVNGQSWVSFDKLRPPLIVCFDPLYNNIDIDTKEDWYMIWCFTNIHTDTELLSELQCMNVIKFDNISPFFLSFFVIYSCCSWFCSKTRYFLKLLSYRKYCLICNICFCCFVHKIFTDTELMDKQWRQ